MAYIAEDERVVEKKFRHKNRMVFKTNKNLALAYTGSSLYPPTTTNVKYDHQIHLKTINFLTISLHKTCKTI